jgi:TetR/AcrR family transcriptional regulator
MNDKNDNSTEERILNAAKQVFYKDGLSGARMQDIADLAGINRAMLHYYYRNKESLSKKVMHDSALKFHDTFLQLLDTDKSFDEKIDFFIQHQIEFYSNNTELVIFALHESLSDKDFFKDIISHQHPSGIFISQLKEEIKKGHIKQFEFEEFIIYIISLCMYPFIGGEMFKMIFNWDDEEWDKFKDELKTSLPDLIKRSIFNDEK